MLQRIQTLWLLLATVCCYFTTKLEFYAGTGVDGIPAELNAITPNLLLTILTVAIGVANLIIIFLYKQMRLQIRMTIVVLLAAIILIVLYFIQLRDFATGTISIWSIIYFGIPVCEALALNGIMKDAKMVRDMDRFR